MKYLKSYTELLESKQLYSKEDFIKTLKSKKGNYSIDGDILKVDSVEYTLSNFDKFYISSHHAYLKKGLNK